MVVAARICPRKRRDQQHRPRGPAPPRLLIAALALILAATAAPAHAAPAGLLARATQDPGADERARLEAIYSAANEATQAGDFASAAERYAEVLGLLEESRENHEVRALALLDSVAARRQAHAASGELEQLCRARQLTRDYLHAADAAHGLLARELDGVRQAAHLRDELDTQLPPGTCPEDQPAPQPARPAPLRLAPAPTPGPDPRVIAGISLLGLGGLSLALMATGLGLGARTEARLRSERTADPGRDIDDLLGENLIQRGQASNRLAVVGGVLAAVTLLTGATLLALGKTRPRHPRVALVPGGLGLRF